MVGCPSRAVSWARPTPLPDSKNGVCPLSRCRRGKSLHRLPKLRLCPLRPQWQSSRPRAPRPCLRPYSVIPRLNLSRSPPHDLRIQPPHLNLCRKKSLPCPQTRAARRKVLLPYPMTWERKRKRCGKGLHVLGRGSTAKSRKEEKSYLSIGKKSMSGIHLAMPIFSKENRPEQGKATS